MKITYRDDETVAYVSSRMPVYSACCRVLNEVRRRLPGFSPAKVLDFGAGTGSAFCGVNLVVVWGNERSVAKICGEIVEPSQFMQHAAQSLIKDLKNLPLTHGYTSLQALTREVRKSERLRDLVIAVLVEPGTPHGSNIISQMRSHILWMERRKCHKTKVNKEDSKDLIDLRGGAFIVAPVKVLVDIEETADMIPYEEVDPSAYDSDAMEIDNIVASDEDDQEEETVNANLGDGWGRIVFSNVGRGRQVHMNVCQSTNPDASKGSFGHEVITQTKDVTCRP
ncbi:hypothetical protein V6N12_044363 [Hibiscus sabdariffa]|uniref:Uncharacterized protein n=1 Tax=Hibiscus sabdariffa TaxID=183260 RepID=A0ABR2DH22_9ROSI